MDSADPSGRALELARSATPAKVRRRTALATVARPAAEVVGLLVEVLGNPRVETPLVVRTWEGLAFGPRTMSKPRSANQR